MTTFLKRHLAAFLVLCSLFGSLNAFAVGSVSVGKNGPAKIGEVIRFANRTTAGAVGYSVNATAVGVLPPGAWMIYVAATWTSANTANVYYFNLFTTTTNGTGSISAYLNMPNPNYVNVQNASASENAAVSAPPVFFVATSPTPLYAQGYTEDAAVAMTIYSYAVRVGP